MRVVLISKALVMGAYRQKAAAIASEPDVELTVIVPPYWREGGNRLALEAGETPGYRLIVTPMARNGSYHTHFYPALPRLLAQLEPDLCHIDEEPYNLATYLALRAARRVGARTVCFAWQNLNRCYPPPFRWIEQYVYARVDGAIAGNHAAGQVSRDKGYRGPLAVIPQFGVDPDLFVPSSFPRPADRPYTIGYAGRLVEEKGLLVLLEALARLPDGWHMRFYGDGPLGPELKARVSALGLADQVSWVPRMPSQEMPGVLAALDVVVLPSLTRSNWMEQFGRILIEAMSCETPVIGSDSGEIPHVIGDGGLVVPENDPEALAQSLARLRDDPALRRSLGRQGRARVLAHYTQAQIARDTCSFYRQIAG